MESLQIRHALSQQLGLACKASSNEGDMEAPLLNHASQTMLSTEFLENDYNQLSLFNLLQTMQSGCNMPSSIRSEREEETNDYPEELLHAHVGAPTSRHHYSETLGKLDLLELFLLEHKRQL